jgi:hypothetical protein
MDADQTRVNAQRKELGEIVQRQHKLICQYKSIVKAKREQQKVVRRLRRRTQDTARVEDEYQEKLANCSSMESKPQDLKLKYTVLKEKQQEAQLTLTRTNLETEEAINVKHVILREIDDSRRRYEALQTDISAAQGRRKCQTPTKSC